MVHYNKLVRDNIPQIIKDDGKTPVTHTATDEEYLQKLRQKLEEEVAEFLKEGDPSELADIAEVVGALAVATGSSPDQVEATRQQKNSRNGAFSKRIILERVD